MIKKIICRHYLKKAEDYENKLQNKKALSYYNKILAIDKYDNINVLVLKGFCYGQLYDKENAFQCFDELFDIFPNDVIVDYHMGMLYNILSEYELAIECFDKFLAENPNDFNSIYHKGVSYLYLKNYDKALQCFDKVLENENDFWALLRKSSCYSRLKKHDEAIKLIKIILEPCDNATILGFMCDAYILKGDYGTALRYANKILKINPKEIQVIIMKSKILAELGKFEESLEGFNKVSKMKFDNYKIINMYYSYYMSSLELMGKYDEALKIYDEYLNKYPHFPKDEILKEKEKITKVMKNNILIR